MVDGSRRIPKDVELAAHGGRTVPNLSHNLTVAASLCERAHYLDSRVKFAEGPVKQEVVKYVGC